MSVRQKYNRSGTPAKIFGEYVGAMLEEMELEDGLDVQMKIMQFDNEFEKEASWGVEWVIIYCLLKFNKFWIWLFKKDFPKLQHQSYTINEFNDRKIDEFDYEQLRELFKFRSYI